MPEEKAKAVVSALEHEMTTELATKSDLRHQNEIFDLKLKALGNSSVIPLTGVLIAMAALAATLQKLF